jgi:hypothetical protein
MSTEETHAQEQVWGAPPSGPRSWGWRESLAAVAVAAVIAALGGAAIYAATAGGSHSFGPPHQAFGPGGPGNQHGGIGRPAGMEPPALHGEFVEPGANGTYLTVVTQTGTITAISPTSVSVRSEDGFNQSYVIPAAAGNTDAPFAVDDRVEVRAMRNGQTLTVTNIGNPQLDGLSGPGPGAPSHRN